MIFWAFMVPQFIYLSSPNDFSIWNLVITTPKNMTGPLNGITITLVERNSDSFTIRCNITNEENAIIISLRSFKIKNIRKIILRYTDDKWKPENASLINRNSSKVINFVLSENHDENLCNLTRQRNSKVENRSNYGSKEKRNLTQPPGNQYGNERKNHTSENCELHPNNIILNNTNSSSICNESVNVYIMDFAVPLTDLQTHTNYSIGIGVLILVFLFPTAWYLIRKIQSRRKRKRYNNQRAFKNEIESSTCRQILHESNDVDEHIYVDNELYISSESIYEEAESQQLNVKEFQRTTQPYSCVNQELYLRFQNINLTKSEINIREREPDLQDNNAQVTKTSTDDKDYDNIPLKLETDPEIDENYNDILQGREIHFTESPSKMLKRILKSSNEHLEKLKHKHIHTTLKGKINLSIHNDNESSVDKEESVDDDVYEDPEEIMIESKKYPLKSNKKDFVDPHPFNYLQNTPTTPNEPKSDEEFVDNCLYGNSDDIMHESNHYSAESQKRDFIGPHPSRYPQKMPSTPNETNLDEEFVDNCLYGNSEDIMHESNHYSAESQKRDFVDPHPSRYPQKMPSTLNEEPDEDSVYEDLEEILPERKDYSAEFQKRDFVDPHPSRYPEKMPSTPNETNLDEEFVDNCLYGNSEDIMHESNHYSAESQKRDFVDPHPSRYPPKMPSTPNKTNLDEEFVENCLYGNSDDIMHESNHYSAESQKMDFVDPHPSRYPEKMPSTPIEPNLNEAPDEDSVYEDLEEILPERKDYSAEFQKRDFVDPHPSRYPQKMPSTPNETNLDEEFVDNCLYGNSEDIMHESNHYSAESQKRDFVDPHPSRYPEKMPSTPNKTNLDEEFVENCLYGNSDDIMHESNHYSAESQKMDFVDPHPSRYPEKMPFTPIEPNLNEAPDEDSVYEDLEEILPERKDYTTEFQKRDFVDPHPSRYPQKMPSTPNETNLDEEFVDNCLYGNSEDIMHESNHYSAESQKRDFVDPHPSRYPQKMPSTPNKTNLDEEFVENCLYGNSDDIMHESNHYSAESQKMDFVDPHPSRYPQKMPSTPLEPNLNEEHEEDSVYEDLEEILPERKDYSTKSQKRDFVDPHPFNYPQKMPSTPNKSNLDEEFVENCLYGNLDDIMHESNHYSAESQKRDFVDPHPSRYPQKMPSTPNKSNSDEEFVENCLYGNLEDIMHESNHYSAESHKRDFVHP